MQKSFITIMTNTLEDSTTFYCDILGFEVQHIMTPAEDIKLIWLKNENDMIIELAYIAQGGAGDNSGASITLTFQVEDLESKRQLLIINDVPYQTHSLPNGSTVHRFSDPNGTAISFMD